MKRTLKLTLVALISFAVTLPLMAEQSKGVEEYREDLKSENVALQLKAVQMLGEMRAEEAVEDLIALLADRNTNNHVAWNSALSLGLIGKKGEATEALLSAASSSECKLVQYTSILSLMLLNDSEKKEEFLAVTEGLSAESEPDELLRDLALRVNTKLAK